MWHLSRSVLTLALVACGISGCGSERGVPGFSPLRPSAIGGLSLFHGPLDIYPGAILQFQAVTSVSTGLLDVTSQTAWSTTDPSVLTVSPNGVAVALAPGSATVSATYQKTTVAKPVYVMPEGTFRLQGWVLEKDARSPTPALLATVEVISGIGTGLKFVAVQDEMGDYPPAYIIRGVAGPVTIAASAAGYVTQTIALDVQSDMRQDFVMAAAPPQPPESIASAEGVSDPRR